MKEVEIRSSVDGEWVDIKLPLVERELTPYKHIQDMQISELMVLRDRQYFYLGHLSYNADYNVWGAIQRPQPGTTLYNCFSEAYSALLKIKEESQC